MSLTLLPLELQEKVKEQLERDETVRWAAQPVGGGIRPQAQRRIAALGLLFVIGGAVGTLALWGFKVPAFAEPEDFVGLIAAALGLMLGIGTWSMLFLAQRLNAGVVYVITDRRAFILHPLLGGNVRAMELGEVTGVEVEEQEDDAGTLVFRGGQERGERFDPNRDLALPAVPHVRRVEMLLRQVLRTVRAQRG